MSVSPLQSQKINVPMPSIFLLTFRSSTGSATDWSKMFISSAFRAVRSSQHN